MSNSSLATYTNISANKTSPRTATIDTISIHCVVGQWIAQKTVDYLSSSSVGASCNYAVGTDGSIAIGVEEKDRSWCTSSSSNDHRAITIEVASDTTDPYAVNDVAMSSLINLLVDVCQRNNIDSLKWQADSSLIGQVDKQNMTVHRWFSAKACPGDYLYNLHGEIADKVNVILNKVEEITGEVTEEIEMRYNKLSEMPDYAQETIVKMVEKGLIKGSGTSYDENNIPADMDLSLDMIRIFVTNDRAGVYDVIKGE